MKDKILNALKSKAFFALAINIVIMALIIGVTAFSYDSADDFYNSLYICQYHNYYNNDINYIFATITGSLQYILLNFNCFVLFQILLSCAAFSSVTFVFQEGGPVIVASQILISQLIYIFGYFHTGGVIGVIADHVAAPSNRKIKCNEKLVLGTVPPYG